MAREYRFRFALLVGAVLLLAVGIAAQLVRLQVRRSQELSALASRQHRERIEVPAIRGSILDRHGSELALSLATQTLFAHPHKVRDHERAADLLAPVIDLSRAEILDRLRSGKRFVYLERFMEPDEVARVQQLDLPVGPAHPFGFLPSSKRYYPHGRLAGHLVGFAGIDGTGVEGIEKEFNEQLSGDPSYYMVLRDAHDGQLRQLVRPPAKEPRNVVLTIDGVLQHIVERELDRAMHDTKARAAMGVLIEPTTGQVLALANRPAADLNRFPRARDGERTNRAVVHEYEPGSTFKIVTVSAALELKRVRPDQRFDCENGTFMLGTRSIRDIKGHRLLSVREIVMKSSNIGVAKIARLLKPQELRDAALAFGFGSDSGVELPGERSGTLRPLSGWDRYSRESISFGQEVGVTVLQMGSAFATLANEGTRVPPRVVLGTTGPDGRLERFPTPGSQRVISRRTARELSSMLEGVITDGTGKQAGVRGYRLAGKSGTGQKFVGREYSKTDFMASFAGYGPVDSPRLVALVVVDSPRGVVHGGEVAAPVFRRIVAAALRHLRVPADGASLPIARERKRSGSSPTTPTETIRSIETRGNG